MRFSKSGLKKSKEFLLFLALTTLLTGYFRGGGGGGGTAPTVYLLGYRVYTAGYYKDASRNEIPCYWRGTARTELLLAGAVGGRAVAICVP